jgi:hypothetical protein
MCAILDVHKHASSYGGCSDTNASYSQNFLRIIMMQKTTYKGTPHT